MPGSYPCPKQNIDCRNFCLSHWKYPCLISVYQSMRAVKCQTPCHKAHFSCQKCYPLIFSVAPAFSGGRTSPSL